VRLRTVYHDNTISEWYFVVVGNGVSKHLCTAIGSSQEPGTDWTTMLVSLTPHSRSFDLAPSTNGSMMERFHRACTMPTRSGAPSNCCGVGPFTDMAFGNGESLLGVR